MQDDAELKQLQLRADALAAATDSLPEGEHKDILAAEFFEAFKATVHHIVRRAGSRLRSMPQNAS